MAPTAIFSLAPVAAARALADTDDTSSGGSQDAPARRHFFVASRRDAHHRFVRSETATSDPTEAGHAAAASTAGTTAAAARRRRRAVPRGPLRGQPRGGEDHVPLGVRLRRDSLIIDVVMADEKGYFDDLCLDVELQPSFSTDNYPIVPSNDAQFASGGSFSEVVNFAAANEADLVAVAVEGRSAIDCLIVKPGTVPRLEDFAGTTDRREGQARAQPRGDARIDRSGRR